MIVSGFAGLTFFTKNSFLDQINHQYMELILSQACSVDKVIKGASVGDPWSEIGRLLYLISNPKREAA